MRLASRAIVLSRNGFGEADQYIEFLTLEWGIITALARSARKSKRRYAGGLDLFCHDEIFLRGNPRERPYLTELTVLNSFLGLRDRLERITMAGKLAQWVRKLPEPGTPVPGIFSLLGQTLAVIEKEEDAEKLELLGLVFKLKLLAQLGLKPQVEICVKCESGLTGNASPIFDISSGGTLCRSCFSKGTTSEGHVTMPESDRIFLAQADSFRLTHWSGLEFPEERTRELQRVVTLFGTYHTHVRLPV